MVVFPRQHNLTEQSVLGFLYPIDGGGQRTYCISCSPSHPFSFQKKVSVNTLGATTQTMDGERAGINGLLEEIDIPAHYFTTHKQLSFMERGAACIIALHAQSLLPSWFTLLLEQVGMLLGINRRCFSGPVAFLPDEDDSSYNHGYWGQFTVLLMLISIFGGLALVSVVGWGCL